MSDLEKVFEKLKDINGCIGEVLKTSTYPNNDDMSRLQIDYTDSEQLFLLDELRGIMEKLEIVYNRTNYLKAPVVYTGKLSKNSQGRYELPNGRYYTSGDIIECLINDGWHEHLNKDTDKYESVPYWVKTAVEHDGEDYYLVSHKDISMQGLEVRLRSTSR